MSEAWIKILEAATEELYQAAIQLDEPVNGWQPKPVRTRTFVFGAVVWPHVDNGTPRWKNVNSSHSSYFVEMCQVMRKETLAMAAKGPRRLLRLLRRIQAATRWCRARRAGQERAYAELLKQQGRATAALNAEAVAIRLRGSQ